MTTSKKRRVADLSARVHELEIERIALRLEVRDHRRQEVLFVGMLLRAGHEMGEPVLRAGFLEELEAMVPGALDEIPADQRPAALRKRAAK